MAKKTKAEITKELEDAVSVIRKYAKNTVVLAEVPGNGLFNVCDIHGDKEHSAYQILQNMLMTNMLFAVKHHDSAYEQEVTQGKADFAYCMCLDILHTLLRLGATDFADIHEDIENDGEDWLEDDDIEDAETDKHVLMSSDEGETEEVDLTSDDVEKVLAQLFKGKSKSFKTKDGEEITVASGRLSSEDGKKLVSALASLLGEKIEVKKPKED